MYGGRAGNASAKTAEFAASGSNNGHLVCLKASFRAPGSTLQPFIGAAEHGGWVGMVGGQRRLNRILSISLLLPM